MVAAVQLYAAPVPPASHFEGPVLPSGRLRSSPEQVERRRLNRAAGKAASRRPVVRTGAARTPVIEAGPDEVPDPYKFDDDVRPTTRTVACSEPWVEAINDALLLRRENGKPVIPYAVRPPRKDTNADGEETYRISLSTQVTKLVELVAQAGVYPPVADDRANQMRPCCCARCRSADGARSRLYPGVYVRRGLSFECWCDRHHVDPELVEQLDPDAAYLLALSRFRERDVQAYDENPASGRRQPQRIVDRRDAMPPADDDWRYERLGVLGIESRTALAALRGHRWTHVGGTVEAKLVKRWLTRVGDLHDFVYLYGRKLAEVAGLTAGAALDVRVKLERYTAEN